MIEPILSLAMSLHSNKGVYALLIGSGISRSAGIPTGWEVVEDLIRKIATLRKEDCEPDPAAWYKKTYGVDLEYSKLLDEVAKSPAERQKLIKGYFEPTEEEREQGLKMPTAAHKAIAELVRSGHLRLIITTNFDRLIEKALDAVGINPIPIYTPEAIKGAPPLSHQEILVIKLHGDYLDTRIKNTPAELSAYDKNTNEFLDRIFDEFGVIICGWSADWDAALRNALERCKSRRYTTYWTVRGQPTGTVKGLMQHRKAELINIHDADSFLRELAEKIWALEDIDRPHPLSAKVAVATLKKYIAEERCKIQLHDLVAGETERLHFELGPENFPVAGVNFSADELIRRLKQYESLSETLLSLMIMGCYWGKEEHSDLWVRCLERIANPRGGREGFLVWADLRLFPALLLLYGAGIAALVAEGYKVLGDLLLKPFIREGSEKRRLLFDIYPGQVLEQGYGRQLPGMDRRYTPLNDHLFTVLRDPLREILPDDTDYDRFFDLFEYIRALIHADFMEKQHKRFWAPPGRFAWKQPSSRQHIINEVTAEIKEAGAKWPPLNIGLFDGSVDRINSIREKYHKLLQELNWWF